MQSRPSRFNRALDSVERLGNRLPDPVLIFLWLILAVVVLSVVGVIAGWEATNPVNQQPIRATSLLSSANLERLFIEMPRTLTGFAPLGYVLLVMLGAGIAERTGLAGTAMRAAVRQRANGLADPDRDFHFRHGQPGRRCCLRRHDPAGRSVVRGRRHGIPSSASPRPSRASPVASRRTCCPASSTRCCSASPSRLHNYWCPAGR